MSEPRPHSWMSTGRLLVVLAASLCLTGAAPLQSFDRGMREPEDPMVRNVKYDGRFTFARLQFTTGPGGYYYMGLPAWAHGYPRAEQNLVKILSEISAITPHLDGSNVIALDDPALFKYPVAYMTEAGFWTMTDKEATALRAYFRKGGFVIFDDFRSNFRGGGGWNNFDAQMQRVLPKVRYVDLEPTNPIFHSFFEINSFDIVPQYYDQGRPIFRGIYEDDDPRKPLIAIINFNTDVSNFWEFATTGFKMVDDRNQAFKLGVNYIVYGMTH